MKTRHLLIALGLLLAAVFQATAASNDGPSISAAELSNDLDQWLEWMGNTHPDLSYSVDAKLLEGKIQAIKSELKGPMSRRNAWKMIAGVNPLLNDGHLGIRYPVEDYQAHLDTGGKAFSLAVVVTADNHLHTAVAINEIPANTLILRINGENADAIVVAMMQRARGDNDDLRRALISRRFPAFYWSLNGDSDHFEVELSVEGKARSIALSDGLQSAEIEQEHFRYSKLSQKVGYLYIDTFDKKHAREFATFLEQSFQQIQQQSIQDLIIDLRDNGGGARDLSDQLVNYLTTDRVSPVSAVKARVVPENQKLMPGATLGSVVATPYRQWYQPDADLALRFGG